MFVGDAVGDVLGVVETGQGLFQRLQRRFEPRFFLAQLLRSLRLVPDIGLPEFRQHLVQTLTLDRRVKGSPEVRRNAPSGP